MVTSYFLNLIAGNVMNSPDVGALPTTFFVALSTGVPTGDGSDFAEVSGGGYTRVSFGTASEPADGTVSNLFDIEYREATGEWGTVQAFGLYDALEGGNLLMWDVLQPEQTIVSGNQVRFKPGALQFTFRAETA